MGTIRLIGETKADRTKVRPSRGHGHLAGRFLGRVRGVFAFMFVMAVFVFAFCYRADLQDYVISNLYKWSQAELKSGTLRQSALNHENEVNRVMQ